MKAPIFSSRRRRVLRVAARYCSLFAAKRRRAWRPARAALLPGDFRRHYAAVCGVKRIVADNYRHREAAGKQADAIIAEARRLMRRAARRLYQRQPSKAMPVMRPGRLMKIASSRQADGIILRPVHAC